MLPYEDVTLAASNGVPFKQLHRDGYADDEPLMANVTFSINDSSLILPTRTTTATVPLDNLRIDHASHFKVLELLRSRYPAVDEGKMCSFNYSRERVGVAEVELKNSFFDCVSMMHGRKEINVRSNFNFLLAPKNVQQKLGIRVSGLSIDPLRSEFTSVPIGEALIGGELSTELVAASLYGDDGQWLGPSSCSFIHALNLLYGHPIYSSLKDYLEVRYIEELDPG